MYRHWRKGLFLAAVSAAALSTYVVGCGGDDQFINPGGSDSGTDSGTSLDGTTSSPLHDGGTDGNATTDGNTGTDASGSDGATDAGDGGAPTFAGVTTPFDQWTWVPIPNAVCADGSPTGIAVNPHAGSTNLTVYFEGGGACWTDATCQGPTTLASYLTGYGTSEFDKEFGDAGTGGPLAATGIFERTAANPLQEENFVYVPYCTGDIHAGNNVASYDNLSDGGTLTIHHVGYNNAKLDIAAVRAAIPSVNRLVVTGSSAGGYGALFNYEQIHLAFSEAKTSFLIDDSGPPLAAGSEYVNQNAKWNSWANVPTDCPACTPADGGAFENIYPYLAKQDPNFKGSLLETDHDLTISNFFSSVTGGTFGPLVMGNEDNIDCANSDGGVGDAGGLGGPCDFTSFLYNVYAGGVQVANDAGPGQMHAFIENAAFHTYLLTPDKFAMVAPFLASQLGQDGGLDGGWTDQVPSGTGANF